MAPGLPHQFCSGDYVFDCRYTNQSAVYAGPTLYLFRGKTYWLCGKAPGTRKGWLQFDANPSLPYQSNSVSAVLYKDQWVWIYSRYLNITCAEKQRLYL